jgi:hypothetical protein
MSDTTSSAKALKETVQRYQDRDEILGRLQVALENFTVVLSFIEAGDGESPSLTALKDSVSHYARHVACSIVLWTHLVTKIGQR